MSKTRERKKQEVELLKKYLTENQNAVFANFFGLKVKDINELRRKCRENNLFCAVAKKTLLSLALKEKDQEVKNLQGEIMVIAGGDEAAAAKCAAEFGKKYDALKILAGLSGGQWASLDQVLALSKLPSYEELLAKLVCRLAAPVSGFVNVLAGNLRGLLYTLNAIKDKKVA